MSVEGGETFWIIATLSLTLTHILPSKLWKESQRKGRIIWYRWEKWSENSQLFCYFARDFGMFCDGLVNFISRFSGLILGTAVNMRGYGIDARACGSSQILTVTIRLAPKLVFAFAIWPISDPLSEKQS